MADVVTRFKLETTQFDSKLRDASKSLADISREASKAGKGFADFTKDSVEAARALGQTESSATNTKDKLKELVNAFNDAAKAYNGLTQEQKQSDFGKAMAESLDTLKGRIADTKQELQNVGNTMKSTSADGNGLSGILGGLADKFGLNVTKLGVMGTALGATSVALKVAKDAFFASEANVDEWGRTIEAGKSVYEGFLIALNTGDFNGFISNINGIISAAKQAYDALDRLGSMQRILAPSISGQSKETRRIRNMLQTGTYIAPEDGRAPTPGLKDGQRLTPAQMKALERQLTGSIQREVGYQRQLIGQTNTSIDAVYNRTAKTLGMTKEEFLRGTSSMTEFDRRTEGAARLNKWIADNTTIDLKTGREIKPRTVPKELRQFRGWDVFRVDGKDYGELMGLIQQRDQQEGAVYDLVAQGQRTINRAEGVTARSIMSGGGGGGRSGGGRTGGTTTTQAPPPAGSIAEQEAKVQALTKAWREATDEVGRAGYAGQLEEAKKVLAEMQGKPIDITPQGSFKDLKEQLQDLQKQRELLADPIEVAIIDEDIQRVQDRIDELNGKLKDIAQPAPITLEEKVITAISDERIDADMQSLTNLLRVKIENGLEGIDIPSDYIQKAIFGEGIDIPDEYWRTLAEEINAKLEELGIKPITIDVKTGNVTQTAKEAKEGWQDAAKAVQSVGGALQMIEDPGAKVAGIIGEAIANIALGFAQATAASTGGGPVAWIAAIAGGLGTMISTISAIKSATAGSYAEGGIIPGNSYSGDKMTANVNSGELILNRAQQNSIAGQLTSNQGNSESRPYVDVETIWLGMGHYLKRKGMGEIVTTR